MKNEMPEHIFAWMGHGDNGSWDKEPCACTSHPSVLYVRADLHDKALTALKIALAAINMTLEANAALEDANIIICTGTKTTRKLELAKQKAEEVFE